MDTFFDATRQGLVAKLGEPCIVYGDEAEWDRESYIIHHCETTGSGWIDKVFYDDDAPIMSDRDLRDLMADLAD